MESVFPNVRSLNEVPSVVPDEWDRKTLKEIATDPDCHEFMTEQEMLETLNDTTLSAMQELEDGGGEHFDTLEGLWESLED